MQQDLHQRLEELINRTEPGGRLPSEPKLAGKLGVSRATLREVMRTFEMQGLLRRRQGVGTFVMHPPHVIESGLEVLESIETLADKDSLADVVICALPSEIEDYCQKGGYGRKWSLKVKLTQWEKKLKKKIEKFKKSGQLPLFDSFFDPLEKYQNDQIK